MPLVGKIIASLGIKGIVALGLVIALGVVMWRADAISEDREALRNDLAAERAGHAITRQSVETLQASLTRFVGAGKAARVAQLASIEAQAKDSAKLQAQAAAIRAELETMTDDGRCASPGSVINAEGL